MKKQLLLTVMLGLTLTVFGQSRAHEINARLGRGVNLGNSFEAPRDQSWGVEVEAEDLKNIADHGFEHVRIPVRWNDWASASPPYTIEPEFLDTIRKVVDAALDNKLHAMVNIHHYDAFNDNPEGTHLDRFLAIWKQISVAFREYPDSLLFEFLNEPHQTMDAAHWNPIFKRVLDTVRVDNPTRICVVGPPDWNNVNSVDKLVWTADTNMILTVHYYNPFQFTHQGASWVGDQSQDWLGTTWDSTAAQRQAVIDDFSKVRTFAEQHNVPVHVGEFGAYSAADNDSRARWTAYCARTFESFGFSWAYWEYQAGFGVYDPANAMWRNYLLKALTEQIDPNSVLPEPWEIRNGSFTNGMTGWGLNLQGEAAATVEEVGETAVIDVTAVDGTDWHVQLSQGELKLIQGGEYRLSFDAWAGDAGKQLTAYLGQSVSPYAAYSDFETFTLATSEGRHSFTFTMNDPTDPNARVVFNLGHDAGVLYLDSIVLEQLFVPVLVEDLEIVPNPAAITEKEGSIQLSVNVTPGNANNQEVTWEVVAGGSLATISPEGLLTATGVGDGIVKVRVTAADGSGTTAEVVLEVTNQLLVESIKLNPVKTVIDTWKGATRIFYEVLPANASDKTLRWEVIQDEVIAKVSLDGLVTALGTGDGEIVVRATSTDGSDVSDEVTMTIMNQVLAESVEITAPAVVIDVLEGTLQYSATVMPENTSRKEIAWQVKEGAVLASIDQSGLLTATGNGNGQVTVRGTVNDGSGVYDEMTVTLSNQGTGLDETQVQELKVWTAGDLLHIELPVSGSQQQLSLFSIDGRKLLTKSIPPYSGLLQISMQPYGDGIYLLRLDGPGGAKAVRVKLIHSHMY